MAKKQKPAEPKSIEIILKEMFEAADSVLSNSCDSGANGPDEISLEDEDNYYKDKDGDYWYQDMWDLNVAVEDARVYLASKGKADAEKPDHWEELPAFPLADWKHEVMDDNTRLGYWAWAAGRQAEMDEEATSE